MSISTKIQSIEQNLQNAYSSLNKMGVSTENQNIKNIAELVDEIYENAPKTEYGEGSNIILNNTLQGQLDFKDTDNIIKIGYGNMYQQTYIGNQLFNIANATLNSILIWANNDYYSDAGSVVSDFMTIDNLTNIASNYNFYIFWYDNNKSYLGNDTDLRKTAASQAKKTIDINTMVNNYPTIKYFKLVYRKSVNANIDLTTANIMLNIGTTATSYEPYVGGIPAPNPNYPQNVKAVTGDNQIIVMNKNICNRANRSNANSMYARYENGGLSNIVTLSFKTDVTVEGVQIYPDGLSELAQTVNITANQRASATFNLTDEQIKTAMSVSSPRFIINKTNAGWTDITEAQIENNSEFTGYIAHQEQVFAISLGSTELCKIGNYTDSIIKKSDGWYLHKEIEKQTLNGTESWSVQNATTFQFVCRGLNIPKSAQMYCNKFVCYTSWQNINTPYFRSSTSNGQIWAELGRYTTLIDEATVAKWKAWLTTNTPILYHPLIESTETKITDTNLLNQLNAIEKVSSYTKETYITINNNLNLPIKLKVRALKNS